MTNADRHVDRTSSNCDRRRRHYARLLQAAGRRGRNARMLRRLAERADARAGHLRCAELLAHQHLHKLLSLLLLELFLPQLQQQQIQQFMQVLIGQQFGTAQMPSDDYLLWLQGFFKKSPLRSNAGCGGGAGCSCCWAPRTGSCNSCRDWTGAGPRATLDAVGSPVADRASS